MAGGEGAVQPSPTTGLTPMESTNGSRTRSPAPSACLTCAERQSPCDRRQPQCLTCRNANLACKGYSTPLIWRETLSNSNYLTVRQSKRRRVHFDPEIEISARARRRERKRAPGEIRFVTNWPPKTRRRPMVSRRMVGLAPETGDSVGGGLLQDNSTPDSCDPTLSRIGDLQYDLETPAWTDMPSASLEGDLSGVPVQSCSMAPGINMGLHCFTEPTLGLIDAPLDNIQGSNLHDFVLNMGKENCTSPAASVYRRKKPSKSKTQLSRKATSICPQIRYENNAQRFSILLEMYDREFCTYPVTIDFDINPFRYRRETSTGSQHLLHAIVAFACHHQMWSNSSGAASTEVTRHRNHAEGLYRTALRSNDIQHRGLSFLDTLMVLWCVDATTSALHPWKAQLQTAYDLLETAGGIKAWSQSARVKAQVSMLLWWDGVIALMSRSHCVFPYSYLEAVLQWEGSHDWNFIELNACPRELIVPIIQLANLTGKFKTRNDVPSFLRPLLVDIQTNLRKYRPAGNDPSDDPGLDPSDEVNGDNFHWRRDQYHCCEAFRYSLLIYMVRIFERPDSPNDIANYHVRLRYLSRLSLDHMMAIHESSPLRKQLLLPLFLAGAETDSESHRRFIKDYCATWFAVYGYQMFSAAANVMEEVWDANHSVDPEYWWGDAVDGRCQEAGGAESLGFCFG